MERDQSLDSSQYLTFKLGEEVFALEILKIREVLDYADITKVPRTPEFMRGVINLRGNVVPVVDLRVKFEMEKTEQTLNTCIIIVEIMLDGETTTLGAIADSVEEVVDIESNKIEIAPRIGLKINADFIKGMGKKDDKFIIILDIDRIFSVEELSLVSGSEAGASEEKESRSA